MKSRPFRWIAAALAVMLLPIAAQAQGPTVPADRLHLGDRVDAVVELNYYVGESGANVVFDIAPGPMAADMRVRAVLDREAGEDVIAEERLAEGGPTVVTLPLADLAEGEFPVALSILAGDQTVWKGEDTLVKRPAPPDNVRITQVDRYRRIILVDGERFFPMGAFGIYEEYLPEAADAGFNITLRWKGATTFHRYDRSQSWDSAYNRDVVHGYLDAIHDAGMYAVETPVKLAGEQLYQRYRDPKWHEKYPVINAEITPGIVRHARHHPAVIGYYNYDEPDNFYPSQPSHPKHLLMQEGVEAWYDTVRELDPYHAVMTLFAVGLSKVEDWKAWDVAMRDYYIYRDKHMSKVYEAAVDSAEVAWRMRTPFVYTPLFEKSSGRPVPLSPEEQRSQTYLSLVADVKGLFYWDWPAAYAPNWEMLKQLAGEVRELSPILLERAPRQEVEYVRSGTADAVKALVKNHEGRSYLIAVSAEPAPVRVTYRLPERFSGEAAVRFEDRSTDLARGAFTDTFEPYARHVYELPGGAWVDGEELSLAIEIGQAEERPDPQFEPTGRNLIANSSFEYDYARLPGWPVGWHPVDTIMESGQVGVEDGRWTPVRDDVKHGERSLRLIRSAPGTANTDDLHNLLNVPAANASIRYPEAGTYTLSAWMKADEPSRVLIMNGWNSTEMLDVDTEWKRYEVPIERSSEGNGFIRIAMMDQGILWIDAVQMEKGSKATEYKHLGPVR